MSELNLPETDGGLSGEIQRVLADVEQVFRGSEARIEAILRSAVDAIITIESSGIVESFNPAAEQMFGYSAAEVVGRNVSVLMPSPHREDHDQYIGRYLSTGTKKALGAKRRLVGLRKDEEMFPMELSLSEVRLGDRTMFTAIIRDISAREKAEIELRASRQFLQATLDALPQQIAILDERGIILAVNAAWERLSVENCLPSSHGLGDNYLDARQTPNASPCDEAERVAAGIRHVIGGQVDQFRHEYRCPHSPGDRWFSIQVTHFESDTGVRAVVAHEDITQRKRVGKELEAAKEEAELGNRMKDEFLAMLSHELRNPLAPVRHGVTLLRREDLPRQTRDQALRILAEQVDHMVYLINDLLDVTRISQGKIGIQKRPCDVAGCVRRAVEATRPFMQKQDHQLNVDLPGEPVVVDGDPDRLQQVVANLLGNAAKYTPAGGAIDLQLYRDDESAVIRVRDNGIGMTDQDLRRVFEPFTQAGGIGADTEGGLGLGLTLVRRLVELHGGSTEARSEGPGHGSEFTVVLPLTSKVVTAVGPADETEPPPRHQPTTALKILVVDDNSAAADMLTALLEIDGHAAIAAYDGQSAIEMVQQTCPDVVLLDLRMPKMNGYEVARALRKTSHGAKTLLIAMSGLGRDADVERARLAGFDQYLVKPVEPSKLHDLLARLSGGQPMRNKLPSSPE